MKIGIIICDRYRSCGGGKCLRAMRNREGAFSIYDKDMPLEVVGYTSCGELPGGNVECVPRNDQKRGGSHSFGNGNVSRLSPCPRVRIYFKKIH